MHRQQASQPSLRSMHRVAISALTVRQILSLVGPEGPKEVGRQGVETTLEVRPLAHCKRRIARDLAKKDDGPHHGQRSAPSVSPSGVKATEARSAALSFMATVRTSRCCLIR